MGLLILGCSVQFTEDKQRYGKGAMCEALTLKGIYFVGASQFLISPETK